MTITELSIKRPAMMSMVILLFVIIGLIVSPRIGIDLFPRVNIPVVSINTVYTGAGPEEIETQVIKPIEDAVSSISDIKSISSTASEGRANTIIMFNMSANIDIVATDVQKKVDSIRYQLPSSADTPIVAKYDFNAQAVTSLALSSNRPQTEIYQIAKQQIKERLEQVPGVAQVDIVGGQEREIQVRLNRYRMESYGLTISQVIERLNLENLNVPGGLVEQGPSEMNLRVLGEFNRLEDISLLRIPLSSGGTVALGDIGQVVDGYKENRRFSRFNGSESVSLTIQKRSDANLVNTVDNIDQELVKIGQVLPPDVKLVKATDSSVFIRNSLRDTMRNLVEGILMTGLVLLFFLREWRSTLIVMLAIPTSMVATLALIYFAGFSFNILSLMGLTMCIGILVDDSIVILENIHRHRFRLNKSSTQAAIEGRSEIGLAAVAITMSDVVVFAPMAVMTGMVGQFFKEFGFTVVFASLFSLFVSFTLTPMLAARLFKGGERRSGWSIPFKHRRLLLIKDWLINRWNPRWDRIQQEVYVEYTRFLNWALDHRRKTMAACLLVFVGAVMLFPTRLIQTEFLPRTDQGELVISLDNPPGTSLNQTSEVLKQLEYRVAALPETKQYFTTVGRSGESYGGSVSAQSGNIQLQLLPRSDRNRTTSEVAAEIRDWDRYLPGVKLSVLEPGLVGIPNVAPVQVNLTGPDPVVLQQYASQIQEIVRSTPGAADVDSTWRLGQPEIRVNINRLAAANSYLSVGEVAQTVRSALEGEVAGKYRELGQESDLRVSIDGLKNDNLAAIRNLGITNQMGQIIRLDQVADVNTSVGPSEIRRYNRQRLITIKANTQNRPLGEVMKDIDQQIKNLNLPSGYLVTYEGEQQDLTEGFSELTQALLISIVLVYAVLVMLYESYLIPAIRMLSLPLGMVGALLLLVITGRTLSIVSLIGIIMLDGLVAKNSTLLIDYTHTIMQRENLPLRQALIEAGTTRLRPIVMTSITMIAGMIPTAIGTSVGSEIRSGMAIALIGGLLLSTLLTLVVIPVSYTLLDDLRKGRIGPFFGHRSTGRAPE